MPVPLALNVGLDSNGTGQCMEGMRLDVSSTDMFARNVG